MSAFIDVLLYAVASKNYKTRLQVGQSKVQIPAGVRDFSLLPKTSRQALEPYHLPSQWVLGFFPGGKVAIA